MDSSDLGEHITPFEHNGEIWLLESHCMQPTCTMINPATGQRQSFGMGGITASEFKRLDVDPKLFEQLMDEARKKHPESEQR